MQLCFNQRIQAYKAWQTAESTLLKKRESEAKAKAQNKADKIPQAEHEVKEAEKAVEEGRFEFEAVSKKIKVELERFTLVQVKDLQTAVIDYVESVMTMEHQTAKAWEAFLPEAKAIPLPA